MSFHPPTAYRPPPGKWQKKRLKLEFPRARPLKINSKLLAEQIYTQLLRKFPLTKTKSFWSSPSCRSAAVTPHKACYHHQSKSEERRKTNQPVSQATRGGGRKSDPFIALQINYWDSSAIWQRHSLWPTAPPLYLG